MINNRDMPGLRFPMILVMIVIGLLFGKAVAALGLAQPWWPLSVSGESEVVIRGTLKQMPPVEAEIIGFSLETATGNEPVDFNRISAETINKIINRKVVIRGVRREGRLSIMDEIGKYQVGSFVEVSWVNTNL